MEYFSKISSVKEKSALLPNIWTLANTEISILLFRILLILMVIILHYFNPGMGGALGHTVTGSISYYFIHLMVY